MANSKYSYVDGMHRLYSTTAARQRFCVGWKVVLRDGLPLQNQSYSSESGLVFTEICEHGEHCEHGQEVLYFLIKLIAKGFVQDPTKYWKTLFPESGSKIVRFSSEIPMGCAGFKLTTLQGGKVTGLTFPVKGYHFGAYGAPFTTTCDHSMCSMADKYLYALIKLYGCGYIPDCLGDGKEIFKLLGSGSWGAAQMECLLTYGSLQYFYENPRLWPINIHKLPFDITDVLWVPSSLKTSSDLNLFDDGMSNIMIGLGSSHENNREIFGMHGVLPGEQVAQPLSPSVQPLSSHSACNGSSNQPTNTDSSPSQHCYNSPSSQGAVRSSFIGSIEPQAMQAGGRNGIYTTDNQYEAYGVPQPSFSSQPENPWISHPSSQATASHLKGVAHSSPLSNQLSQESSSSHVQNTQHISTLPNHLHATTGPALQDSTPASSGNQSDKVTEKKDRFRVKVSAAAGGERMIYVSRDLFTWANKHKLIVSSCAGCKLALNKMNTVSLRAEIDVVPLITDVIKVYISFGLPIERIREILMDLCFKAENSG